MEKQIHVDFTKSVLTLVTSTLLRALELISASAHSVRPLAASVYAQAFLVLWYFVHHTKKSDCR